MRAGNCDCKLLEPLLAEGQGQGWCSGPLRRPKSPISLGAGPCVDPNDLTSSQHMASNRGLDLIPRRTGRQTELDVEHVDPEQVMMRLAGERAGTSISKAAEAVGSLGRAGRHCAVCRHALCEFASATGNTEGDPVRGVGRSVRIAHEDCKVLRSGGRTRRLQLARVVVAVACESPREAPSIGKTPAFQP